MVKKRIAIGLGVALLLLLIAVSKNIAGGRIFTGPIEFAWAIAILALLVAWQRGGVFNLPFLFVAVAAYPLLAPFVSQRIFKFNMFSLRAQDLQYSEAMAEPTLVASLGLLVFAFTLKRSTFTHQLASLAVRPKGVRWEKLLIIPSAIGMVFFAWLTEPGGFVYFQSYSEITSARIEGTAFAGGAWAAMAVLLVFFRIRIERYGREHEKQFVRLVFWLSVTFSIIYLIGHARRSEVAGFIFFIFILKGINIKIKKRTLILIGVTIFALFTTVEMVRQQIRQVEIESYVERDHHTLPGGAGNVIIGYFAAYYLWENNKFMLYPGETYVGHILRIPPAFLKLPRPPIAYEYIDQQIPLTGGEYFLNEPIINFGIVGVVIYAIFLVAVANWASRSLERAAISERINIIHFLIAGTFVTLMFRTLWYGLGALVKGVIIASIIGVFLKIIVSGVHSVKR